MRSSTFRSLPATPRVTFIEVWMMGSMIFTFMEVILHTAIEFLRFNEQGRDTGTVDTTNTPRPETVSKSEYLNNFVGRIGFLSVLLVCTVGYWSRLFTLA